MRQFLEAFEESQTGQPAPSRRFVLKALALGGAAGFVVGFASRPALAAGAATRPLDTMQEASLTPFVRVGSDNTVTVLIKHLDKGQGVTTGLPTIVAEELDADWSQMRAEFAPADAALYNNLFFGEVQGTGGSTAIANSWMQLRKSAAAARAMLVEAAAQTWGVPASEIRVERGVLGHTSGKAESFGTMAAAAARMSPPADPPVKNPKEFTLIGTYLPRLDSKGKTDGTTQFAMDFFPEDARVAVLARPPKFGGKVKSFDATAAKALPGVEDVVETPRGLAVLAGGYWPAIKGREALSIEWDETGAETRGTADLMAQYKELAKDPGLIAHSAGDVDGALGGAAKVIEAEYEYPYLVHAPMEPLNATAQIEDGTVTVWAGSQLQTIDQFRAAEIAGVPRDKVTINTLFAGGSFGRRATPDADMVSEAVMIAKAAGDARPVKLIWSREDDIRGGRYRPMNYHRLRGALDGAGNITGWDHRLVGQSILRGTSFENALAKDGIDESTVEGAADLPYKIPAQRIDVHTPDIGIPVLWWRSVGHTHTAFSVETFFDELATAAGQDPVEMRRRLLSGHERHLGVLNLAAERAGWGETLPAGRGRGIAVHESFNSFVAEVVDVSVADDGAFTVDKVVCAVDCGIAINPDVIEAQMQGGIGYGLSAALHERVEMVDGEVQNSNFHDYEVLRIDEMPKIEVHIVQSGEAPTGVGEPGLPPLAPALANAIFAATGKRLRTMPFGRKIAI